MCLQVIKIWFLTVIINFSHQQPKYRPLKNPFRCHDIHATKVISKTSRVKNFDLQKLYTDNYMTIHIHYNT